MHNNITLAELCCCAPDYLELYYATHNTYLDLRRTIDVIIVTWPQTGTQSAALSLSAPTYVPTAGHAYVQQPAKHSQVAGDIINCLNLNGWLC